MHGYICLHILQYRCLHGLLHQGVVPYPIGLLPRFLFLDMPLQPVMEAPWHPLDMRSHHPDLCAKDQDGLYYTQIEAAWSPGIRALLTQYPWHAVPYPLRLLEVAYDCQTVIVNFMKDTAKVPGRHYHRQGMSVCPEFCLFYCLYLLLHQPPLMPIHVQRVYEGWGWLTIPTVYLKLLYKAILKIVSSGYTAPVKFAYKISGTNLWCDAYNENIWGVQINIPT